MGVGEAKQRSASTALSLTIAVDYRLGTTTILLEPRSAPLALPANCGSAQLPQSGKRLDHQAAKLTVHLCRLSACLSNTRKLMRVAR